MQNVENGILKLLIEIRTYHKELSIEKQLRLKCKIQRSIVYDYLKTTDEYNSK